jgi:hypothetical protein
MKRAKQAKARPPKARMTAGGGGISALSEDMRDLVSEMLGTGASFEDTAGLVNEHEDVGLTLRTVENFFRANLKLQQKRIRRQLELAQRLKTALIKEPTSPESELAEAVLFTGLMALNRRGFRI